MNFLFPSFLWALVAVVIPIIIHLFNFRRYKKIYFSNIRFLKEVQEETKSTSRLKHLLILISRILFITFLVLAFAQPFLPLKNAPKVLGSQNICIYIDNSFSMESVGKNGSLLNEAKKKAKEIVKSHSNIDRFKLLTNDFEGWHQNLYNKEEVLDLIDEVVISPESKKISEIKKRTLNTTSTDTEIKKIYLLSDFQKSITDFSSLKNDSAQCIVIPMKSENKSNIYIDSCWFTEPVQQLGKVQKLEVKIKNNSNQSVESGSIKLGINKQIKTPATFSVEANNATTIELPFTLTEAGIQQAQLEITDNTILYDNKLYFTFNLVKSYKLAEILPDNEPSTLKSPIQSLFGNDSLFQFHSLKISEIDYSTLSQNNLLILNQLPEIPSGLQAELQKIIRSGVSVLLIPNKKTDLINYNQFLQAIINSTFTSLETNKIKIKEINYKHPIYQGVFEKQAENIDLPITNSHYVLTKTPTSKEETLLKLENEHSFLSEFVVDKGKLYILSTSLDEEQTNLTKHALFVPTLYQIALNSEIQQPLYYTIGQNTPIEITNSEIKAGEFFKIKSNDLNTEVIPENRILNNTIFLYQHQVTNAGNYFIYRGNDIIQGASFNYNRNESELSYYSGEELRSELQKNNLNSFTLIDVDKNISSAVEEINKGTFLWKYCIILALLFLGLEIALVRIL